jgi:hypothetical protein
VQQAKDSKYSLKSRINYAGRGGLKGARTRALNASIPIRKLLPVLECEKRWAEQDRIKQGCINTEGNGNGA